MTKKELKTALVTGQANESEISKRSKHFVIGLFDDGAFSILATERDAVFCSDLIKEEKFDKALLEVRGNPACSGKAAGIVKIVNRSDDMAKMNKGDVLVSIATTPDLVSAMRLAAAIVTDAGGLTSHAAIVSRELNVPCVIGTKVATKWLKDGDKVEVDASNGTVKKLSYSKPRKSFGFVRRLAR